MPRILDSHDWTAASAEIAWYTDGAACLMYQSAGVADFDVPSEMEKAFRIGMTAKVDCYFPALKGLFVPKNGILFEDENPYVNLAMANGEISKQPVELGAVLLNEVEIVKGAKEGDHLVLSS